VPLANVTGLEEQIIAILKEHEAGVKTADLCRKHGISEASFYNFKAKYGGLEVSEAKRLKGLGSENVRLKKLLARRNDERLPTLTSQHRQERTGRSPIRLAKKVTFPYQLP